MNSYYRLYHKKPTGSYWSGGAYYETLQQALDEYQRLYAAWKVDNDYDFKIVHTDIKFNNKTKITTETEHNPVEVINDLAGGGS